MGRQPARTAAQKQSFLENFAATGTIEGAAELTGIDSSRHRAWLKQDAYRVKFQQAFDKATDTLVTEARRRALGFEDEVWYQGRMCGHVRRYSDILLIFLLKAARPEQYRDNYRADINVHGTLDQRVIVNVVHEFRDSPPDQLLAPPAPPLLPTLDLPSTDDRD